MNQFDTDNLNEWICRRRRLSTPHVSWTKFADRWEVLLKELPDPRLAQRNGVWRIIPDYQGLGSYGDGMEDNSIGVAICLAWKTWRIKEDEKENKRFEANKKDAENFKRAQLYRESYAIRCAHCKNSVLTPHAPDCPNSYVRPRAVDDVMKDVHKRNVLALARAHGSSCQTPDCCVSLSLLGLLLNAAGIELTAEERALLT